MSERVTNEELALEVLLIATDPLKDYPTCRSEIAARLDKHRPTYETVDEPDAIANLTVEISDHPNPLVYTARRIYNAEFGYHEMLGRCQAMEAIFETIEPLVKAGRAAAE